MRVTIEVGNGQELCYLLAPEINTKRTSRDVLAAMPPEQRLPCGSRSYQEYVKWCEEDEEDLATYTAIRCPGLIHANPTTHLSANKVVGVEHFCAMTEHRTTEGTEGLAASCVLRPFRPQRVGSSFDSSFC